MIDDSDFDFAWMLALFADNPIIAAIMLVILIFVGCQLTTNKEDCAKKHCDRGAPVLANHDCMCMEKAK